MIRRWLCATVLGAVAVSSACGQGAAAASATDAKPGKALLPSAAYDVATFKRSDPNASRSGGGPRQNGTLIIQNNSLKNIICAAYDFGNRCEGGPAWIASERYDIEAKPDDTTAEQLLKLTWKERAPVLQRMQQALLADRLKLKVHFETREMTVLALVVAKGGLKIHEAKPGDTYANGLKGPDGKPIGRAGAGTFGNGLIAGQGMTLDNLANLSNVTGYRIENKTGLTGLYDFTLHYSPIEPPPPDSTEPSVYTALEQQLGLKLEPTKEQVQVVVIDHAERPSQN